MIHVQTRLLPDLFCDIVLHPEPGKIDVLTGENGIGKTTLLKHLSHTMSETIYCEQKNAEIFFDRELSQVKKILLKSSRLDRKFFGLFWEAAGFHEKESRMIMTLSGGEAQMLKLLLHASASGDVYLFDEPGQYLDPAKKKLASVMLSTLLENGKKIIVVEHDPRWISVPSRETKLENKDGVLRRVDS